MNEKKNLPGATNTEQERIEKQNNFSEDSIAHKAEDVNILREIRLAASTDEVVSAVQQMHPKYDKTLQSKCENTADYGVCLEPQAMKMLIDRFAKLPATTEKRADNHKLKDRAACRLEPELMKQLKAKMKADGFTTVQGCIYFLVKLYLGDSI